MFSKAKTMFKKNLYFLNYLYEFLLSSTFAIICHGLKTNICLLSEIIQGCMEEKIFSSGFPNPSFNSECQSFTYSRKTKSYLDEPGPADIVLYNRNVVFEFGSRCIWLANDGYWSMGYCDNIGGNPVYILKDRNQECPDFGPWFSGSKNLGGSVKTSTCNSDCRNGECTYSFGRNPKYNSASASVTYQKQRGRYVQSCCWKKSRSYGNWVCTKKSPNQRC